MEVLMEPKKKMGKKKWILFGAIVIIVALIATIPAIIGKRHKQWENPPSVDFMVKVTGTIRQAKDNTIYLKGDNNLYYILLGDKLLDLQENKDKKATVFGNIMVNDNVAKGIDDTEIEGNPVRMRIGVVNFELKK
jgi:hypothetical protein